MSEHTAESGQSPQRTSKSDDLERGGPTNGSVAASAEKDAGRKRCPHCNRVALRTMTDYICLSGCGWHEHHDEPIPTRVTPPASGREATP